MADDFSVTIEGLDPLLRKLNRMGSQVYRPAMAEAGAHIKAAMAVYPPRQIGRKQPPKTMRQFIFLIHAIAEGIIDFPYRRGQSPGSQAMGRRWWVDLRDGGKTAIVGNNASYVRLVQSAEDQSEFHKGGGWKTDRQVVEEETPEVMNILARHIAKELKRG